MKTLFLTLSLIVSLAFFCRPANTQAQGKMEFDEPGSENILNRQLWQFARGSSYDSMMAYVRTEQAKSEKESSDEVELPTGWKIDPAGKQIQVGRLPYEAVYYQDRLVVLNTGFYSHEPQEVSVIDPSTSTVVKTLKLKSIFPCARIGVDGNLYISGGFNSTVYKVDRNFDDPSEYRVGGYAAGLAPVDSTHIAVVYVVANDSSGKYDKGKIALLDVSTGKVEKESVVGYFPYDVVYVDGKFFVTMLGENRVNVYDKEFHRTASLRAGTAPASMSVDGRFIYVVNQTSDNISVIDAAKQRVVRTIFVGRKGYDTGVSPTSCAIVGGKLYVSEATINAVAVYDLRDARLSGYIPTGWYTTKVLAGGGNLFALSAKGIVPRRPNPNGPQPVAGKGGPDYVLTLLKGAAAVVPFDAVGPHLREWTRQVEKGAPFYGRKNGLSIPIKHVFYIIKENRSYDQVLGDLGRGNGDSTLTIFGMGVTPNVHKLATDFVTLDNFFVDGEISVLGHSFTTSGYASPFLEWLGNAAYSGKYKGYPFGTVPSVYSKTYVWDALDVAHLDYRVYGEPYYLMTAAYKVICRFFGERSEIAEDFYRASMTLASDADRGERFTKLVEPYYGKAGTPAEAFALLGDTALVGGLSRMLTGGPILAESIRSNTKFRKAFAEYLYHYPLNYRTWDLGYSDLNRYEAWKTDFDNQLKSGRVVPFEYIWLPNDHTAGTSPLYLSPYQLVAQNDIALGLIVKTISQSPIWRNSLILVEEDDAQNGPDHVDATRTEALALGPYVRRGAVVSDRYDQLSMLRTAELLLGFGPLNFGDAMAVPMFGIFSKTPDLREYSPAPASTYLARSDAQILEQIQNHEKVK